MENPYQSPESEVELAASEDVELASLSARFWGAMVDGIVGITLMFGFYFISGIWARMMEAEMSGGDAALATAFGFVCFALIHSYTLANRGQTIGKVLLKTQIVSVQDDSILPLWKVLGLRYLPLSLVTLIPLIGNIVGIANVLFIFRADRRCLHDHIAGTKVIKYVG